MMEGIKEWWSPIFFSFFSSYFLSSLVILAASRLAPLCQSYQVWWSDTRQDWAQKARAGGVSERKKDEEEQQSNYLLLADIYPALLTPPHPMSRLLFVHSFLHTFLALIRQTVYCLVICLSQFCLLSSVFHDHPTLPCFAFLYLAFHLTLPYSV